MSWVQHNPQAPPPLPSLQQQQHAYTQSQKPQIPPVAQQQQQQQLLNTQQQQQQLSTQTNSANTANVHTNPSPTPLASNPLLPAATGTYLNKPTTANNNNNTTQQLPHNNSIRSQMHANGGGTYQPQQTQQQQPGHFGEQQQQQQPSDTAGWQQQIYMQPSKMIQSNTVAANNNWQQQQQQQPLQQQYGTNLYEAPPQPQQQQQTNAAHNIWQPPDLQTAPAASNTPLQQQQHQQPQHQQPQHPHPTTYDNYFTANQATLQPQPAKYQQPPPPPPPQQVAHDAPNFFQPQQQSTQLEYQQHPQAAQPAADYFDKSNANKSDGWGDWEWNDNGNVISSEAEQTPVAPQQQQQQPQQSVQLPIQKPTAQQPHSFDPQTTSYSNLNVIEDSFRTQSNNNWSWNLGDDAKVNANTNALEHKSATLSPPQVPTTTTTTNNRQALQVPRQVANSVQVPQQKAAEFAVTAAGSMKATANSLGKPTALPLSEATNENYNTSAPVPATNSATASASIVASIAASTNSNIPNSVYVSQAKPVSRPSRQYASPPNVASPTSEPLENALAPPQAFQNKIGAMQPEVVPLTPAAATTSLPPPPAMTPPSNVPPPPGPGTAAAGNPFKRAGAAQHHRAGLLNVSLTVPPTSAVPPPHQLSSAAVVTAFAVPPPPADFANPLLNHLEPDNSEILHENQEVLGIPMPSSPPPLQQPITQTVTMHGTQTITMPGTILAAAGAPAPLPPPPNDERNQYLQTSPLSENPDEELNLEADSLPPPGLSRLVLGQPEWLEASQRMVTGTEEPANMHMDERHADGEDTSLEQAQPVPMLNASQRASLANSGNLGAPSASASTIDITTDRNLYLVPGESNANNEQRVVTGFETVLETNAIVSQPQIASGQREIELDGENLEDQQQQQHQPQLQQPPLLTVNSRYETPLEGAAASSEPPGLSASDNQDVHHHHHHHVQHHHHHQLKSKDHLSNASTGNDESDPVVDHQPHQHAMRYAGANKSRKQSTGELERKATDRQQPQRREKQRSSVDRYESDDLELDESEPFSSDHERERERRRGYREGSARSDRERDEREYAKDKRRRAGDRSDKRDERAGAGEREKYYGRDGGKTDTLRRSVRQNRQYDENVDEKPIRRKEQSRRSGGRHHNEERAGRSDRSERDYDDYNRRPRVANKRGEKGIDDARRSNYVDDERRDTRRTRRERGGDYDNLERRRGDKTTRGGGERGDVREYEEYRKQSSRNARESDLEKEQRGRYDPRHAAMYGYPPSAYGYDPYTSYYYEQMARTNPQAYSEWYKKYYGHASVAPSSLGAHASASGDHVSLNSGSLAAATADGRESVHSGRSSVQNDKERSGHLSLRDADAIAEPDPQRLTPRKFVNEHTTVSLSAGILVTVKPKYTSHGAISNVVKLQRLGVNDATRQLFQAYPGPLVRGITHKKTIIEFCEEQIRLGPMETTIYAKQLVSNNIEKYRGSYTLMWNLLILLLRQNGMVVGTDIAELLLKNQQQFPYQIEIAEDDDTPALSDDAAEEEQVEHTHASDIVAANVEINETDADAAAAFKQVPKSITTICNPPALTEAEITEKFRNYLIYGNVNEALDWATDNNLWGHALFLASKVDRRSHANVMMKFANKLSLNDPLQTLYQLMSGRQPSSVTSVQDEKWGDWRPHLSMILSNTSQKPELDRKSITTLGDSLLNRGDLFAAHFCYLMAQVGFGRYQYSATLETTLQQHLPKLILLGSSHYKNFNDFAANEAIMMTEIYEYACSLNDDKFSLVEFQPYKYLLATRLLDYGFHLRSLMYFEQIALHIQRDPSKYEQSFIYKIYEYADRLKYYDLVLERSIDEQQQTAEGNLNNSQLNFEEQKWLQDLRVIAVQHKVDNPNPSATGQSQIADTQSQIDQQFVELNKQFNELNMQYNAEQPPTFYNPDNMQQQQQQTPQQQAHSDRSAEQYNQLQQQPAVGTDYNNLQSSAGQKPVDASDAYAYYNNQQQQYMQPEQQHEPQSIPYYDPTQQHLQQQQQHYQGYGAEGVDAQSNAGTYDYWAQQQQQQHQQQAGYGDENARPTISMPKSKNYDSEEDKRQKLQAQQKGGANEGNNRKDELPQHGKKETNKSAHQGNQNSGWFGGIWNKLSLKPKNQMILPDDKNPSIVWDSEKKRWMNTDGDEAVEESFKPPPKMSDIMAQAPPAQSYTQQQQQQQLQPPAASAVQPSPLLDTHQFAVAAPAVVPVAPSASPAPVSGYSAHALTGTDVPGATKTPSLQSNMFKMQRNRTLKNSYVDVFNPSGVPMKPTENVLAPALPPAAVPQSGFFIPGPSPVATTGDNNDAGAYQQQQQQMPQDVPQFYNPNQFGGGAY